MYGIKELKAKARPRVKCHRIVQLFNNRTKMPNHHCIHHDVDDDDVVE